MENLVKVLFLPVFFHAYKIDNNQQSCFNLLELFGLERKTGLAGLKYFNINMPNNLKQLKSNYITPENIIIEIMDKFEASKKHKNDVIELYNKIKNKSSYINRSRPQSIASGLVRYYILIKKKRYKYE